MTPAPAAAPAAEPPSALLSLLPHALRLLRREPALAITLGYLLLAMAGISYNYSFYRQFDIPVLTLSQIGDFLVAGLQQPIALLLVLSTFPLCWLFDLYNARTRRKEQAALVRLSALPRRSAWQRLRLAYLQWHAARLWPIRLSYLLVIALYGWAFVGLYARHRAETIKRGEAVEVRVWLNGEATGLSAGESATWTYLGAIANYVFVYDRSERRALILPVNAIARLQPVPRRATVNKESAAPAAR